jgi:hypothetical protein
MSQQPKDISLDVLLRTLERRYAYHAAWLFRANGIPEPPRLPEPALPESTARAFSSEVNTGSRRKRVKTKD